MMDQVKASELLAGKTVIVTGAGRGIGAAISEHTAQHGANVVVCDIDLDVAEETAEGLRRAGGSAVARRVDVSDWTEVEKLVDGVAAEFGSLDGLVNNAGRFAMAMMEDSTPEMWQSMLSVNVLGVAICGQFAARQMVAQGSGSIVNVVSGAQSGMPAMSVYGATKGAVASLTYTWALELGPKGVRVNAISPMAGTRMIQSNRDFRADRPEMGTLPADQPAPMANAPAVTFLLSDLASNVQGQVVRITGQDLGLMGHPAVLVPLVHRDEWTVESIAEVFESRLRGQQLPQGLTGLNVAGWVAPEGDGWRISGESMSGESGESMGTS